jgi:hypothetical protein
VKKEHARYFEVLQQHPRLMVGMQVPAIGKEGMETIRDSADAKEWQDAVKQILAREVQDRASRAMEENKSFLDTIHSSIELFQNNLDLIPGTKGFDLELANRFATLAKPYELRNDGKLQGYSIPVQPIIDQLRTQVAAERAAKAAAAPAPTAAANSGAAGAGSSPAAPAAGGAPAADPPQVGITSKAGNGDQGEDFSTLFGTIGLPNLRI